MVIKKKKEKLFRFYFSFTFFLAVTFLPCFFYFFFFFNDTATTEIYTLSLHDALPISPQRQQHQLGGVQRAVRREGQQRQQCPGQREEHEADDGDGLGNVGGDGTQRGQRHEPAGGQRQREQAA